MGAGTTRLVSCCSICTCDPPYEQWLIGMGGGCCAIYCRCGNMALSTWSTLRASARSGGGQVLRCWLLPRTVDPHDSPYEQALICMVGITLMLAMGYHHVIGGVVLDLWEFISMTWGGTWQVSAYTTSALVYRSHCSPPTPCRASFHLSCGVDGHGVPVSWSS